MVVTPHPATAPTTVDLCTRLAASLMARRWKMVTAESCSGGLIAAACTDLNGSSGWFERGFVTYSNEAKIELLGVDASLLTLDGAVSEAVVRAMARGALANANAHAQVSVAVTGVAGPTGASALKPVGTVWFGWCVDGATTSHAQRFAGDRAAVRAATVRHALAQLLVLLDDAPKT